MGTWVTVEDVDDVYEKSISTDETSAEFKYVDRLIGRAERLLVSKRPGIAANIAAQKLSVNDVADVVIEAVLRVVRNPEGLSMEMEGNYSYQARADVAGGKMFFTADNLAQVTPGAAVGARTFRTDIPAARVPW